MKNLQTYNYSLQRISTTHDLCVLLGISDSELNRIVNCLPYHYRKRVEALSGKVRAFYRASYRLKSLQHKIEQLLKEFPIHEAAHGGLKGCSPFTTVKEHVGKSVVLEVDLRDCYPSISHHRVYGLFVELGCAPGVARILTKLTTVEGHLAQGLDTSPVIANLMLRQTDARISSICKKLGYNYGRYVDDLIMSGKGHIDHLMRTVRNILNQSSFKVNEDKFKKNGIQPRNGRQQVLKLIVNRRRNLPREKRRVYRAMVHNCWAVGPANETKDGESVENVKTRVQGCLSYFRSVNPKAARPLVRKFKSTDWTK